MKINYFEDTDTALIHFTEKKVVETREVSENVYLDLDAVSYTHLRAHET